MRFSAALQDVDGDVADAGPTLGVRAERAFVGVSVKRERGGVAVEGALQA
jgi:hypothetical protein